MSELEIVSDGHRLHADVYGPLPAERLAILVHGARWDAAEWRPYARAFVDAGVTAIALDLRGHGVSEGTTPFELDLGQPWSAPIDLRATKAAVRARCGKDVPISLVGCSLGGHAVLASSWEGDVDGVVSVSAPVVAIDDALSRRVTGRKLYVCASSEPVTRHVLASFAALERPKELRIFDGTEHAISMLKASYGHRVIDTIVEFVCQRA